MVSAKFWTFWANINLLNPAGPPLIRYRGTTEASKKVHKSYIDLKEE